MARFERAYLGAVGLLQGWIATLQGGGGPGRSWRVGMPWAPAPPATTEGRQLAAGFTGGANCRRAAPSYHAVPRNDG